MVAAAGYIPDTDAIRADLEFMTRRWGELAQPCKFELRSLFKGTPAITAQFTLSRIAEAATWATIENSNDRNIYAVRNPIRMDFKGSATDDAIVASFFCWADFDDPAAAENVRRFDGPRWTAAITTGRIPSPRVHLYWELEKPVGNMDAWESLQKNIAAHFKSDSTVTNPSRVMRIGGSICYPDSVKAGRGYVTEVSTLRVKYDEPRPPVPFERLTRVFGDVTPKPGSIHIDTGPEPLDRALAAANILADKQWRANVKSLVASYVARGWTDEEIIHRCDAFTLDSYTVADTREDVIGFIKWTRTQEAKKPQPEPADEQFREFTEEEKADIPPALFRPWTEINLATIPAPEFVYSDFYARGYTSVTLAAPKVGKSMLGLAEAIDMATGLGILTGHQRLPQRVVYFNAEDDQDVINSRVAALLTHYRIPQSDIVGRLFPTSGVELSDFYMVSGQDGVINEALFVSIEKFCAEQGADVLIFDPLQDMTRSPESNEIFRMLGQRLRRMSAKTGVALGLIHHTRKVAPGMVATIDDGRGGSALRGTARFNRILVGMTEDEAVKSGVANHRHFFRIGEIESNLAPPSSDINRWFEKISVPTPNGHHVGAVARWEWPDVFDGVTHQHAARVRFEIDKMADPPRADIRATAWVGEIVATVLGVSSTDPCSRNRVKNIVAGWIKNDVLRVVDGYDSRAGRPVQVVICGANNPAEEPS